MWRPRFVDEAPPGTTPREHPDGVVTYVYDSGQAIVAAGGIWVPGLYEDEATALRALDVAFADDRTAEAFNEMQARVNEDNPGEGRPITLYDLATVSGRRSRARWPRRGR